MKQHRISRLLSAFMICILTLTMFPVGAMADTGVSYQYYDNGDLKTETVTYYTVVESDTTSWSDGGWYVVNSNVTISGRITVSGTVSLILTDGYTLTASQGINVPENTSLTIYGQTNGTGALNATGTSDSSGGSAGIGSNSGSTSGTITIHGGTITAVGGSATVGDIAGGAGIGSGSFGDISDITIYGGTITATGADGNGYSGGGAGIGGGCVSSDGNTINGTITISGGTINATGGTGNYGGGAGIGGGGRSGSVNSIIISGGVITATGGANGAAGIGGGGHEGLLNSLSITGGFIIATGQEKANDEGGSANAIGGGAGKGEYDSSNLSSYGYSVNNCVVIDGSKNTGTVYGSYTLTEDAEVGSGYMLTIPSGSTLTVPSGVTLTNNGKIVIEGTLNWNSTGATFTNNGTLSGNGTLNPMLSASITNLTVTDKTYNGNAITASYISYTYSGDTSVTPTVSWYSDNNGSIGNNIDAPSDAGTYWVKVSAEATGFYESAEATPLQFTISKANPTVTAPEANELTYTSSAQELVTAGTTTGGEIQYSTEENGTYSTTIPTGTDAGTYTVYYKVVGNDNYNDVAVGGPINVTISKATPEVTAPTATNPTYTGSAQDLVTTGSTTGGEIQYSTEENGIYSTTIPTGIDAGTYTVYYKVEGDDNYNDVAVGGPISVTISKADQTAPGNLTVTQPTTSSSTGTISGLTTAMEYNTDNGDTWTEITGTTLTVNPGKVYIRYAETSNYNASEALEITIDASDPSYTTPSGLTATYGDTLANVELPTATNGTWSWEDSSLSVGDVGEQSFMAVFTPKDINYNTVKVEVSITVAAAASSVETAPTANTLTYNGSAQELITAGTASNGTMKYRISEDDDWSEDIPTATDAGTYTVYYKVFGDENYSDTEVESIEVTIAKKSSSSSGGSSHSLSQTTSSKSDTEETTETTDTTDTTSTTDTTDTTTTDTTTTEDYVIGGDGSTTTSATATETFTDVAETNQYVDAIDYVVDSGLMAGTSSTTFEPETSLTRGMIVTILHRLEGEPESGGSSEFNDVEDSAWYATAVAWAAENGVVEGYGDGSFGPDDAVTREQLAAILYRYAEYKGYDISAMADLGGYIDADDIGDWARSAMEWANAEALLDVKGFSSIEPKSEATRAETASTLMTFVENITK